MTQSMAGAGESLAGFCKTVFNIPLFFRAAVWVVLLLLRHIQAHVLHPFAEWWLNNVVGTWEESIKSVIREAFSNTTRFINGFFTWVVTLFVDKDHRKESKSTYTRANAWQTWWDQPRISTFNALIRRDQGRHSLEGQRSPAGKYLALM